MTSPNTSDETRTPARASTSKLLWALVLVAIGILCYWQRPGTGGDATGHVDMSDAAMTAAQATTPGADPDDILVDLVDSATPAQVAAIEAELGIDLVLVSDQSADEQFYRAHVDASREGAILRALAARSDVEVAEPDSQMTVGPEEAPVAVGNVTPSFAGYPDDPLYKLQWHLQQIKMPAAWKLADGEGVTVAVLDTGVGYEDYGAFHQLPDLAGIEFVDGYNFVDNNVHADDDHGHGSHVTGTIAQATNNGLGVAGIARKVKIMPLKVLSGQGGGSVGGIADAIRYAADKGAKVINMSLGGPFPSRVLKNAVKYAHDKGVTVICAAGNDGRGKVGYPAAFPGAVAVAATQFDERTTFYSNWGKDIDVAAPGGNTRVDQNGDGVPDGVVQNTILTGDPSKDDYLGYMGTSMASPHVAGVAALIVGEGVTSPDAVEGILKSSARKPANQTYSTDKYGAGILDAEAAIKAARSAGGGGGAGTLAFGLLLAGAVAASTRQRGLVAGIGPTYLGGVLLGATGLFFLPSVLPAVASLPGVEMLTRGLPSWDVSILGATSHGNALCFSALVPLALLAVGYGVPRLRAPLAGVAVGVAAHLIAQAVSPSTALHYLPSLVGLPTLWLVGNALACVGLARLALRR